VTSPVGHAVLDQTLPIVTSPLLERLPGVRHAFFTRAGGVSGGIYASLNVGRGSRDDPAAVAENRTRAAAHFGQPVERLLACYQVHSARAVIAEAPWGKARHEADGVATAAPGLVCGALSADCAPILFADPQARVVASAHAGWRGALGGIVDATVGRMIELGAEPARITAVVGPCIAPASYEVGEDFLQTFMAQAPEAERFFSPGIVPAKRQFDLPGFVLDRLAQAGVGEAAWVGHDTCAEEAAFFSNRRAVRRGEGDYGRLLSAIMLED
jgi:YfiH family protein